MNYNACLFVERAKQNIVEITSINLFGKKNVSMIICKYFKNANLIFC